MADLPQPSTYLYRCTRDKLEQHLASIADAGDTVEHFIHEGGRDYVLVCRKDQGRPVTVVLAQASVDAIAEAMRKSSAGPSFTEAIKAQTTELLAARRERQDLAAIIEAEDGRQ